MGRPAFSKDTLNGVEWGSVSAIALCANTRLWNFNCRPSNDATTRRAAAQQRAPLSPLRRRGAGMRRQVRALLREFGNMRNIAVKNSAAWLGSLAAILFSSVGCSTVAIGPGPYKVVADEPLGGEIEANTSNHQPVNRGELLEFQFTSGTSNLRSISSRLGLHDVYFRVIACGLDEDDTSDLWIGNVHEVPTTDGIRIPRRYRAYIPLDLKQIIRHVSVVDPLDVSHQIDQARERGLCIRVGGGAMWGVGTLKSNSIRLPLTLSGDRLQVTGTVGMRATVPNHLPTPPPPPSWGGHAFAGVEASIETITDELPREYCFRRRLDRGQSGGAQGLLSPHGGKYCRCVGGG